MTAMESTLKSVTNGDHAESVTPMEGVFTSSTAQLLVGEQRYTLRVLKMIGSTFLFVSRHQPECLEEIGVAMCAPDTKDVTATTVLGPHISSDSQRLAEKLSKRFSRQFFVSYNVQLDRINGPLMERQLSDYIRTHEAEFI